MANFWLPWLHGGDGLWAGPSGNLPVIDSTSIVKGSLDGTKEMRFEVDGFTAGAIRVLTPPDQDFTIAGLEVPNVFTVAQTIDGSADAVQLVVQAVAGQIANRQEWQDSDGTPVTVINADGNLELPTTTSIVGQILQSGNRFFHTFGTRNNFWGVNSGNFTLTVASAINNTALGENVLSSLTIGQDNVGIGLSALINCTEGSSNFGFGTGSLTALTTGDNNLGIGISTLQFLTTQGFNVGVGNSAGGNITGIRNTGVGYQALKSGGGSASRNSNVGIGAQAGLLLTTADNNVLIGDSAGILLTSGGSNVLVGFNVGWFLTTESNLLYIANSNTTTPLIHGDFSTGKLIFHTADAVTNTIVDTVTINHLTSGTPAAGFGGALLFELESSTTVNQLAGRVSYEWGTATHATRKALSKWTVYDTAEREGIRIEADGSNPMIGFLGATAIVRPAEITDELTTITFTAPGTPDFAIQDLIDSGVGSAFGFATKDEGNTVLSVVANNQARINELEDALVSLGLLTDAD